MWWMRSLLCAMGVFVAAPTAMANDSDAVFEAGTLVLRKNSDVHMEREELTIGPDGVHVSYVFVNRSPRVVDTIVAFPIRVDLDPGVDAGEDLRRDTAYLVKAHGFRLLVDGVAKPVEARVQRRANREELTFYWRQSFPAGTPVAISHQYYPTGGFILPGANGSTAAWNQIAREYCVEPRLLSWLKKRDGAARQVHYILRTAANWASPIGHFRLVVRKESKAQMVSLCADGLRRADDRTFILERRNFKPDRDLKILFVDAAEPAAAEEPSNKALQPDGAPPRP